MNNYSESDVYKFELHDEIHEEIEFAMKEFVIKYENQRFSVNSNVLVPKQNVEFVVGLFDIVENEANTYIKLLEKYVEWIVERQVKVYINMNEMHFKSESVLYELKPDHGLELSAELVCNKILMRPTFLIPEYRLYNELISIALHQIYEECYSDVFNKEQLFFFIPKYASIKFLADFSGKYRDLELSKIALLY
jgi:hypothetical protein